MHTKVAGKRIILGVSGSIAAFKVAGWVSQLAQEEARVGVVMTDSATKFVAPLTFAALSGEQVYGNMFADNSGAEISHIQLGQEADLIVVAPATAQTIARLANGLADDLLTTTILASRAKILIFPAMNPKMFTHPATCGNIKRLKEYGYTVIEPDCGTMACKDEGVGRLPEWSTAREFIMAALSQQDLAGQTVMVTAGPTREPLDPARFLSNRSSGKMGYALAAAARRRGAKVILISGPTAITPPAGVECVNIETAREMYQQVMEYNNKCSVIIKAAAVSDFRSAQTHNEKVKKDKASSHLELISNPDILKELGELKDDKCYLLVGFAAESENLLENGRKKLAKKNLDLIAVNDIKGSGTGFEVDNNQITLIDRKGGEAVLPHTSKEHCADLLLDKVVELMQDC